jgi:hypothetical protein
MGRWLVSTSNINTVIKLIKGQVVFLKANMLIHGSTPVTGNRIAMVFFSHNETFPK